MEPRNTNNDDSEIILIKKRQPRDLSTGVQSSCLHARLKKGSLGKGSLGILAAGIIGFVPQVAFADGKEISKPLKDTVQDSSKGVASADKVSAGEAMRSKAPSALKSPDSKSESKALAEPDRELWKKYRWGVHLHLDYLDSPLRFLAKEAGEVYGDQLRKYIPSVGDVALGRNFWMLGLGFSYRINERLTTQYRLMYSATPRQRTYAFTGDGKATYQGREFPIGTVDLTHEESGNILGGQFDLRYTVFSGFNDRLRFVAGGGIGALYFTPGESKLTAVPQKYPDYRVEVATRFTGLAIETHPLLGLEGRIFDGLELGVSGGLSVGYSSIWVDPPKNDLITLKSKRYDGVLLSPRTDVSLSYHW